MHGSRVGRLVLLAAGLQAFRRRTEKRSRTYSNERRDVVKLDPAHEEGEKV